MSSVSCSGGCDEIYILLCWLRCFYTTSGLRPLPPSLFFIFIRETDWRYFFRLREQLHKASSRYAMRCGDGIAGLLGLSATLSVSLMVRNGIEGPKNELFIGFDRVVLFILFFFQIIVERVRFIR